MPDPRPKTEPAAKKSQAELLTPALDRVKANLELLLGKPVTVASSTAVMASAADVSARIPELGMALGVQASGAVDGRIHCFVEHPLVLSLTSLAQLKTTEEALERLSGPPELSASERDSAKEVALFITSALGDFAKDSTGGRIVLAPLDSLFIPADGTPAIGPTETWASIEAKVQVAGAPAARLMLAVPSNIASAWEQPASPSGSMFGAKSDRSAPEAASDGASRSGTDVPTVWVAGSDGFLASVREAVGDVLAMEGMPSLAKLLAAAENGTAPSLAVVEVASGAEFQLDMIAALRHDPALCNSTVVVALGAANRRNVIRCGALGIHDVVPSDLESTSLAARLVLRARQAKARVR